MQLIHHFDTETAAHLMRVRKTVLVAGPRLAELAQTCIELGLDVEVAVSRFDAMAAIADDPAGYSVVMLDADDAAGIEAVQVSARLLRSIAPRIVTLLVGSDRPLALSHGIAGLGGVRVLRHDGLP